MIFHGGESLHPAAVIAGLIADNRRARAEFLPRLLLPVFAGRRIVVKCNCDQRPDGRDMGIWSTGCAILGNTSHYGLSYVKRNDKT